MVAAKGALKLSHLFHVEHPRYTHFPPPALGRLPHKPTFGPKRLRDGLRYGYSGASGCFKKVRGRTGADPL